MKPYYRDEAAAICLGDCREVLPTLKPVDAIVTDPPYGLEFMGQEWDKGVPGVEFWSACLRALKPGGHLLAFGGTRTHHRLWCAIEDAGFEIRDTLMWLYGSGFPKSLDVSKAIDKRGGYPHLAAKIGHALKQAREQRHLSVTHCDQEFCGGTTNWSWYEGRPSGQRAPAPDTFREIAKAWPEVADLARLVDEAEREVVGQHIGDMGGLGGQRLGEVGGDITAPATDAAKQWEGFGTALRPSWEPILLARKPLEGTVAENVLKHGVGGLNIDGCRVGDDRMKVTRSDGTFKSENVAMAAPNTGRVDAGVKEGRWPANVVLDEEAAAQLDEQAGKSVSPNKPVTQGLGGASTSYNPRSETRVGGGIGYGDSGGPSRFFYTAKASRAERERNIKELASVSGAEAVNRKENTAGLQSPRAGAGRTAARVKNPHPTVKPLALMRWLVLLVTPPGGVIVDPFMGSGSTLRAAKDLGRKAIGIEIEERYAQIAAERMRQTTLGLSL